MKLGISLVGILCMGLTFSANAESLLPQGWSPVKEPSPATTTCKSCSAKAGTGISEEPSLQDNGTLQMNIDLADISPVKQFALKLQIGSSNPFSPADAYQVLAGEKDSLTIKMGNANIFFKTSLKALGSVKVFSSKYPEYAIAKNGEDLILSNDSEEFLFSSKDSVTWQLAEIRSRSCEKRNICFEYNSEGLMTALVLPDGHKYTLEYKAKHVVKVNDPAGSVSEIVWENNRIESVKTILLPEHPFYVKGKTQLNTVRDIKVEYDNKGRILNTINTNGEKFSAKYREENAPVGKSFLTILTYPDGSEKFAKLTINDFDGTKKTEIGYVGRSEKYRVKTFIAEKEVLMKKKGTSFVAVSKTTDGAEVKIDYDANNTAMTSKTDALGRKTSYEYDNLGRKTCVIYPDNTYVSYQYDNKGRLVEIIKEDGAITKNVYDGELLTKVNEAGIVTAYEYDSSNRPVKTIMPDGTVHTFEWDNLFRLVSYTRPDGVKIEYSYAGLLGNIAQIKAISSTGTNSYSKKYAYDTKGRLAKITYPDTTSESFAYDCCNLVKYTDKAGAVTKYAYDAGHRKILEISPNNEKTSFAYDRGLLVKTTYPNKTTLLQTYDKFGKLLKTVKTDGSWEKYTYDVLGNKILVKKSDGLEGKYIYDIKNRLISIRGEAEHNFTFSYDKAGRITAIEDNGLPYTSLARKNIFTYDYSGRPVEVVFANGISSVKSYSGNSDRIAGECSKGITMRYKYNTNGQLIAAAKYPEKSAGKPAILFQNNIYKTCSYDSFGNLAEQRNGEGRLVVRYTYRPDSELETTLTPVSDTGAVKQTYVYRYDSDGVKTVSVYQKLIENPNLAALDYKEEYGTYITASRGKNIKPDERGQKVSEYAQKGTQKLYSINPLGQKTEYNYDEMGQLVKLLVDGRVETTYTYDNNGRISEVEDVLGMAYKNIYGKDNQLDKVIQPNGMIRDMDYDKYGRLIKRTGAGTYPLSYAYTSFGEIDSYIDSNGAQTRFVYDEFGMLTKKIWADGSESIYKYSEVGLLAAEEEAGRVTGYVYDDMNRLVKVKTVFENEAYMTEMSYSKSGKLIRISDGRTAITYQYDDFDRVIAENGPIGQIKYFYNKTGLLAGKSCKFNGKDEEFSTQYFYDEYYRINKVISPAGTYTYQYDKDGRVISLGMNDKTRVVHVYDKAGRLLSKIMNGELLCKYEYDSLNRRTKTEINNKKWDYTYDQYNQLISAKDGAGKTYSYGYDGIGNCLKFNQVAMAYNKLNQISINGYQYDKWGNLIQTPDASYKYDLQNRLIEVKKNNISVKYSYDPQDQRIETIETVDGTQKITKYLMSGMIEQARLCDNNEIAQYHTLGLDLRQSLHKTGAVGAVLASTQGSENFNYLYDGNGNVIASCNADGLIQDKLNYSPFGEQIAGKALPFTFSTKPSNAAGLNYYGFRFYSPQYTRWLSRDPIGEKGGLNIYGFIYNDPINKSDIKGLATATFILISLTPEFKYDVHFYDLNPECQMNLVQWKSENGGDWGEDTKYAPKPPFYIDYTNPDQLARVDIAASMIHSGDQPGVTAGSVVNFVVAAVEVCQKCDEFGKWTSATIAGSATWTWNTDTGATTTGTPAPSDLLNSLTNTSNNLVRKDDYSSDDLDHPSVRRVVIGM